MDGSRSLWANILMYVTSPLCVLVCSVSCSQQPYSGAITITPSPTFKENTALLPTVQLDVVGVTAIELQRWKVYPVSDYWMMGNTFRKSAARQSFVMTTKQPGPFKLSQWSSERPTWKKTGVTSLVLMADLPGAWREKPPKAKGPPPPGVNWYEPGDDPRRLVIPWTQGAYGFFTSHVNISMLPNGMKLMTPVDMSKAVPAAGK